MEKIRSATTGLTTLAKTIANPHDHQAQRLPSFPNLERTAVSPFMTTGTYQIAGGGTRRAILCRSPSFPVWAEQIPQAATGLSQALTILAGNQTIELPSAAGVAWTFGKLSADVGSYTEIGWTVANSQRYSWPNAIDDNGQFWFFTPAACNSAFQFGTTSNITASFELDVECIGVNGIGFTGVTSTISGSASASAFINMTSANVTGWWRPVELRITTTGGAGLSISANSMAAGWVTGGSIGAPTGNWGSVCLWPLAPVPEFGTSIVPYSSTRCTASSVLFTNVTKVVAKEGTIMAARFNSATIPFLGFTSSNMATTHPKEKYFSGMEHGFYAFTLPDENSATFADCVTDGLAANGSYPVFNFSHIGYFTAVIFNDLDSSDSTTLAVTSNAHVEYRSSSTLFPLGFSTTSLESYHVAQMSLASMGTMFENPLHLGAITALASAAVRKFAPIVAPHLYAAARAGGNYLLNAAASKLSSNFKQAGVGPSNTPRAPKKPPGKQQKRNPRPKTTKHKPKK